MTTDHVHTKQWLTADGGDVYRDDDNPPSPARPYPRPNAARALCVVQPGNIFVKNGQYKLGDFGLVTPVHVRSGTDVVEGDSRYMSKELLNDDHSNLTKVNSK